MYACPNSTKIGMETFNKLLNLKNAYAPIAKVPKRLIFLGAPGSGKGTHSEWIKEKFQIAHYSTGDMLREEVAQQTELGLQAKALLAEGKLVADEIVLGMIETRLKSSEAANGCILDGFPRTRAQAEGLDKIMANLGQEIDGCILFECPDELLVKRVCGRRIHTASGRTYHIHYSPPKVEGKDDITGEDLTHRKDDNEETMAKRLKVFHESTAPLKDYYDEQNKLFVVASGDKSECLRDLKFMLNAL